MNTTIQAQVPQRVLEQAKSLVNDGWAADLNSLFCDALQRYVESHQTTIAETFVREDVEWGLKGND
jgi:hypothetical protein